MEGTPFQFQFEGQCRICCKMVLEFDNRVCVCNPFASPDVVRACAIALGTTLEHHAGLSDFICSICYELVSNCKSCLDEYKRIQRALQEMHQAAESATAFLVSHNKRGREPDSPAQVQLTSKETPSYSK